MTYGSESFGVANRPEETMSPVKRYAGTGEKKEKKHYQILRLFFFSFQNDFTAFLVFPSGSVVV
jgi:hypothetical protein